MSDDGHEHEGDGHDDADRGDDGDGESEYRPPHREEFRENPIGHAQVRGGMTVGELTGEYGKAGIGAAKLQRAVEVYAEMIGREDVTNLFGLAGAMVPAGMRQIVVDLIEEGHIDALVTTGANLTHDSIEAIGGKHHHGRAEPHDPHPSDDEAAPTGETMRDHDEHLRDEQVDRIYNVYLPQEHFALFEGHLREHVFPEVERTVSIQEFTAELGRANLERNREDGIEEDPGVAAAAYDNDVPIYCPAIQDSVLGIQAWIYSQTSEFSLDALKDMTHLSDLAFEAEKAGAMVVGGGVPKNYVLQTMLTIPDAYDYAVQLTMDPDHTGGLSGATLDEARSWGKLEKSAKNATVVGDATITLPFVAAAARERADERF
ncbi:deoxyhypusine synthase [Halogeometricum pallidum JCM 14848]|uniref:Deoxyhypusine synthase n=1 Tax=Halogeometricum pallidum JCM 14848 TaxID=1227487 RepID=M0DF32_HALPD|nr:deoxyhypusine synthase [Halogeometricum pallidum]ELZ33347.1 deoxyhypusine synthase [Halogeometricum pallidum JCM 14848]